MKLFDLFKGKEDHSPAKEEYDQARQSYAAGSYQEAIRILSRGFSKDVNFQPLYQLTADCLDQLEAEEEAQLFKNTLSNFNQFESFYDLGRHFFDFGHYDMAIPFLQKANELKPTDDEVTHDLAIVFSRRFQIQKAIQVLEQNDPGGYFWNYWFWLKLKILAGDIAGVEEGLQDLSLVLDEEPHQEDVIIARQKVEEVKEILARYQQVQTPRIHIQDWHFIQYGGIILDFFEDDDNYVAGGRYVATWGSLPSIKEILHRLKIYTQEFGLEFTGIRYMPERNAEIVGLAAAKELDLPCTPYDPAQENKKVLIVAANSFEMDTCRELAEVRDGQVVFALNHAWLEAASIAPDIIGLMSQSYSFPWEGGGLRIIDLEQGGTERTEPDERSPQEIAADIFEEKVEQALDQERLDFYLSHREYLKAMGSKVNNHRFNFMIESPVPGSYFG